jgi:hypothetical protein
VVRPLFRRDIPYRVTPPRVITNVTGQHNNTTSAVGRTRTSPHRPARSLAKVDQRIP